MVTNEYRDTATSRQRRSPWHLDALVDYLTHGVMFEDERRCVLRVNQAFCDLFGIRLSPAALVGVDCSALLAQAKGLFVDPAGVVARIDELLARREKALGDELALTDGRTIERDYVPIFVDGTYRGHLWSYRDVTHDRTQRQVLVRAKEEVEAVARLKEGFLASMSHELRTPLTAVIGASELLGDSNPSDEQRVAIEAIRRAGDLLLAMINDVLDYSKLQAGRFELVVLSFDLWAELGAVKNMFAATARDKGLRLNLKIDPAAPRAVRGDPVRLKQILANLVSNAIKYTDTGGVEIRVGVEGFDGATVALTILVEDTGVGIPKQACDELFKPFYQAPRCQRGGTGLGLSISRRLAEMMGGTLSFSSQEGRGSRFWVGLSLEVDRSSAGAPSAERRSSSLQKLEGRRRRLLVAEDDAFTQLLMRRTLERLGCEAHIVGNGIEAVTAASERRYDAILLDGHMPEMNGHEAARLIRTQGGYASTIPIIAITASAQAGDRERCLSAGMSDYLTKPFSVSDIAAVLGRWLSPGSADERPPPPRSDAAGRAAAAPPEEPPIDEERFKSLCVGDDGVQFAMSLASLFVEDAERRLGDLACALEGGDSLRASRTAHALKGAAMNLGASRFAGMAAQIEREPNGGADRAAALRSELGRVRAAIAELCRGAFE